MSIKVYVIQNIDKLSAEANLVDKLNSKNNVEVIYNASVKELVGSDSLTGLNLLVNESEERTLEIDGMFIAIGLVSQNDFIKDDVNMDKYGYIDSNNECETNLEGVFVAGDCRSKRIRQITTATSDGSVAAINAIKYLNA